MPAIPEVVGSLGVVVVLETEGKVVGSVVVTGTVVLEFVASWVIGVGIEVVDLKVDVLPWDSEVSSDD